MFEDVEVVSSFIQTTPGKLLDPGSITYPILVKIFYCNLSFIVVDGYPALRSFVKSQEIVISKTLINDLLKFSNVVDDSTPNSVALQNAKDMFILDSYSNFSPTKQLTHNSLLLCGKLLHNLLVRTVFSRLEPQFKDHTTLSRLQSLDSEVSKMKMSILGLHAKVSTLTFMLDTFMKEMKGMVVEDAVVEEEEVDEGNAAEKKKDAAVEEEEEKAEEKEEEEKEDEKEEEEK